MGQDSRWLERLAEFEFAIIRPSTRQTSQKRLRVISFPMDGRRSAGEACGSDDIVPGYHDGNVLDTGSSTWLNRWSDGELPKRQLEDPDICLAVKLAKEGERKPKSEISGAGPVVGSLWSQFGKMTLVNDLQS